LAVLCFALAGIKKKKREITSGEIYFKEGEKR